MPVEITLMPIAWTEFSIGTSWVTSTPTVGADLHNNATSSHFVSQLDLFGFLIGVNLLQNIIHLWCKFNLLHLWRCEWSGIWGNLCGWQRWSYQFRSLGELRNDWWLVFINLDTYLVISVCHSFFFLQRCLVSWSLHYNLFFWLFIFDLLVHICHWFENNNVARLDYRTFNISIMLSGRDEFHLNLSLSACLFPLSVIIHSLPLHDVHFIIDYLQQKIRIYCI